jgi:hypothetical protein
MAFRWEPDVFPVAGARSIARLSDGTLIAARGSGGRPAGGVAVWCATSRNGGRTWRDAGVVASDPEPDTDLGDGTFVSGEGGGIYYTYRHNRYRGAHADRPDYAIRVARSSDGGRTWQPHSTVTAHTLAAGERPSRGLWAPFLLRTSDGRLQCYYDDEKTPYDAGFRGHQWLIMRTWNPSDRAWEDPVTVSRAHDAAHLSRDGMGTVVALSPTRLLCALESVQTSPPHANVVRYVTSDDGGKTWSWQRRERGVLYQPAKRDFMALAPFLTRLAEGTLACAFCTDEDRDQPDRSGTPPHGLHMDIKVVTSADGGRTWSPPEAVYAETHRAYLPGLTETAPGHLLASFLDTKRGQTLGRVGTRESDSAVRTAMFPPARARGG